MADTPETPDFSALSFSRSPEFRSIFSDVHRIRIGNGSVSVTIGRSTHAPSLAHLGNIVEEQVEMLVSWTQFKMMALNFTAIVAAIESKIAEIPVPTGFQINMEANRTLTRNLGFPPKSAGTE